MATIRHLTNAPIKEALFDFQFQGPSVVPAQLDSVARKYVDDNWTLKRLHTFSALIGTGGGEQDAQPALQSISNQFDGLSLTSPDDALIVQVRPTRITVSRVSRYVDWEELEGHAHVLFSRYLEAVVPTSVRRIASRYVNRIPPNPSYKSFDDLLARPPQPLLGEGLEGARISDFIRRHVVTGLPGGFTANFMVGTVFPEAGEIASHLNPLVVDIDVYKNCEVSPDYSLVVNELSQIRPIKNALFFGSLTDKGMEQFV